MSDLTKNLILITMFVLVGWVIIITYSSMSHKPIVEIFTHSFMPSKSISNCLNFEWFRQDLLVVVGKSYWLWCECLTWLLRLSK